MFVKAVLESAWKTHTCGQAYFVESSPAASTITEPGAPPETSATDVVEPDEITAVST